MSAQVAAKAGHALDPQQVLHRIRSVLPRSETKVGLHEPRFLGNERAYLNDCIDIGWVSYAGAYVGRFERALAERCGVEHAIAVTSGTVALQVALAMAGLEAGEEVIVPALTFVASANAVVHAGGIPHFVDADERTMGISPGALAVHLDAIGEMRKGALYNRGTGRRIRAIVPVHVFGHPVDMDPLSEIAERYGLVMIEDATEAVGSLYKGRPCGSLAQLAALSFNGNKLVTTGGGGAILTRDAALAQRIRHLTTTAKLPHRWAFLHDEVGWNYRLPNINAALGLGQLERLTADIAAKRRLHAAYASTFADFPGLRVFEETSFAVSNYWLVALLLDRDQTRLLEPILVATNDAGVMTRPAWTPMHHLPMYAENPRAPLPVTEDLAQRIISIPSSPFLAPQ
jgi:perosamine synthetase